VSAEDEYSTLRNLFDRLDEDRAAAPQLIDDVAVVHDFVVYVYRAAIGLKSELNDINGSHHPGAESPGPNPHECFRAVSALDVCKRQMSLRRVIFYLKHRLPARSGE
jgi:hypothetical protein